MCTNCGHDAIRSLLTDSLCASSALMVQLNGVHFRLLDFLCRKVSYLLNRTAECSVGVRELFYQHFVKTDRSIHLIMLSKNRHYQLTNVIRKVTSVFSHGSTPAASELFFSM